VFFRDVYRKVVSPPLEKLVMHAAKENGSAAMSERMDLFGRRRLDGLVRAGDRQRCDAGSRRNLIAFGQFDDAKIVRDGEW
jgi:hypothetical protein